jgi:hypothetical protein
VRFQGRWDGCRLHHTAHQRAGLCPVAPSRMPGAPRLRSRGRYLSPASPRLGRIIVGQGRQRRPLILPQGVAVAVHRQADAAVPGQRLRRLRVDSAGRKVADERVPQGVEVGHALPIVAMGDAHALRVCVQHPREVCPLGQGDLAGIGELWPRLDDERRIRQFCSTSATWSAKSAAGFVARPRLFAVLVTRRTVFRIGEFKHSGSPSWDLGPVRAV